MDGVEDDDHGTVADLRVVGAGNGHRSGDDAEDAFVGFRVVVVGLHHDGMGRVGADEGDGRLVGVVAEAGVERREGAAFLVLGEAAGELAWCPRAAMSPWPGRAPPMFIRQSLRRGRCSRWRDAQVRAPPSRRRSDRRLHAPGR